MPLKPPSRPSTLIPRHPRVLPLRDLRALRHERPRLPCAVLRRARHPPHVLPAMRLRVQPPRTAEQVYPQVIAELVPQPLQQHPEEVHALRHRRRAPGVARVQIPAHHRVHARLLRDALRREVPEPRHRSFRVGSVIQHLLASRDPAGGEAYERLQCGLAAHRGRVIGRRGRQSFQKAFSKSGVGDQDRG